MLVGRRRYYAFILSGSNKGLTCDRQETPAQANYGTRTPAPSAPQETQARRALQPSWYPPPRKGDTGVAPLNRREEAKAGERQKRGERIIDLSMQQTEDISGQLRELLGCQEAHLRLIEQAIKRQDVDNLLKLIQEEETLSSEISALADKL